MKGYVKASRYYHDAALIMKDGRLAPGVNYDEVVEITAEVHGGQPELIRAGLPYQDRNGRLWRQRRREADQVVGRARLPERASLPVKEVVDPAFLEEAVRQLGG